MENEEFFITNSLISLKIKDILDRYIKEEYVQFVSEDFKIKSSMKSNFLKKIIFVDLIEGLFLNNTEEEKE